MSKNMTRKGLAFGAGFALAASGLTAAPAFADNAVLIELNPSAGSGNNVISGSTYELRATFDATVPTGNYAQLRYRIQNPDEVGLEIDMVGGGADSSDEETLLDYKADSTGADAVGYADSTVKVDTNNFQVIYDGTDEVKITATTDIANAGDFISFDSLVLTVDDTSKAKQADATNLAKVLNAGTFEIETETGGATTGAYVFTIADAEGVDVSSLQALAVADFTDNDAGAIKGDVSGKIVTNNAEKQGTTFSDDFTVEPGTAGTSDAAAVGSPISLTIDVVNPNDAAEITVTPFLDVDGSNTISGNEAVGEDFVIEFIPGASVIASVSLVQPLIADTALVALISFNQDINEAQVDTGGAHLKAAFAGDADTKTLVNYAYSAILGGYVTAANTAAADEDYSVRIFMDTTGDTAAADPDASVDVTVTDGLPTAGDDAAVEDSDTASVGSVEADVFTISLEEGDGVIVAADAVRENNTTPDATDYTDAAGTATVREGVESVTLTGFVGTNVAEPLAVDGKTVSVTVTPSGVTGADDFAVNGEDVPGTAAITETTTTDKKGNWSMTVDTAGLDDGDSFTVSVKVDNISSISGGNGILTVTVAEADYDLLDVTDVTTEGLRTIEEGDNVTMSYRMVDQWGDAPANGKYRVAVSAIQNNRVTEDAVIAASANVVDGVATLSFTDNGEGTGTTTVRAAYGAIAGALSTDDTDRVSTLISVVADAAVDEIALEDLVYGTAQYVEDTTTDNRKKLLLEDKAFADYNANLNVPGAAAPEVDATYAVTVAGTVENAANAGLDGSVITVSGTGLLFKAGSVYGKGTLTFVADSDGEFSIDVWSQVGGTRTVSIVSGGKTQTVALPYAGGAAGSEDTLTVATLTSVNPGTTANVIATVKDALGNAVQGVTVKFSTTIGYMAQAEVTTDANGVAVGKMVTAVNDKGSAVVTVSIPGNDDIAAVAQTVTVGTDAATDGKVNVGSFNGKLVVYALGLDGARITWKVGGNWGQDFAVGDTLNRFDRPTPLAGVTVTVDIYVDGVKRLTKSVVTR